MRMMASAFGVREVRDALLRGELTVHDVVDGVLDRTAARGDDAVWISLASRSVLHERAAGLEALRGTGPLPPLFGVPFAVKDNIDVAGLPTTAACPAFAHTPAEDATAVRLLLDAGAIAVGKTNLDQFATGLNGTRSPYGAPESVFGGDLISGGSSSGSAVAVAAGEVAFALGTDTAGSGRVPAAMNGIVGLKPTRGLISTSGVVPACRSLDCVSIFARSTSDAMTVLGALARPDARDPWSRPHPAASGPSRPVEAADPAPPPPASGPPRPVEGDGPAGPAAVGDRPDRHTRAAGPGHSRAVVAVPGDELGLDPGFAAAFHGVLARVIALTAVTTTCVAPFVEAGDLLYGPWVAERLAVLGPFLDAHPGDVLPVTRAVLDSGRGVDGASTFRAIHRLQELRAQVAPLWDTADALLLPTVPTTFTRADLAADPIGHNLTLGRFTQGTNLLDLAAVAVPAGTTADGRPFGVTLLGPAFSEDRLTRIAHLLFEEVT